MEGKNRMVARIPKGKKGAGRFATRGLKVIDWNSVTKLISSYVIPILFGIMILIVFIALIWNWNDLGAAKRIPVLILLRKSSSIMQELLEVHRAPRYPQQIVFHYVHGHLLRFPK